MQGAQALGTSVPPQSTQRQSAQNVKGWHNQENDLQLRSQLVEHIYKLFTQRQKQGMQQEWTEKMPDFVRRLEEALYKTANSKEEYGNPHTLEQRLQLVARRMVSHGGRRPEQGRPSHGPVPGNLPSANGLSGGNSPLPHAPSFSSGQPSFPQMQALPFGAPPLSSQAPGLLSPDLTGMGTSGAFPSMQTQLSSGFMTNGLSSLHNLGPAGQVGGSGMLPTTVKLEQPGLSGLGLQGVDGLHSAPQYATSRAQGGGPMMSNGAPVIMRNSRDSWSQSGHSPVPTGMNPIPQGSKITINGVTPGQLGGNIQNSMHLQQMSNMGPMQMQQPPRSPALRGMNQGMNQGMNGGMVPLSNGLGGVMSNVPVQNSMGSSGMMMPLNMQGEQRRPGSGGMIPMGNGMGNSLALPGMPMMGGGGGDPGLMHGGGGHISNASLANEGMLPSTSGALQHRVGGGGPPPGGSGSGVPDPASDAEFQSKINGREGGREYIAKQQRWLLFLRHCAKCNANQGECQYGQSCTVAKALWRHILECANPNCGYPRCVTSRELLKHHQKCQSTACPVCTPVKQYVQKQRMAMQQQQQQRNQLLMQQQQQHEQRAQGMGPGSLGGGPLGPQGMGPVRGGHLMGGPSMGQPQQYGGMMYGGGPSMMMAPQPVAPPMAQQTPARRTAAQMSGGAPHPEEPPGKRYRQVISAENRGTSLLEAFSGEDIRLHLAKLREATAAALSLPKGKLQAPMRGDMNTCTACWGTRLLFEPAAIYCTSCVQKIRRNQAYYTTSKKMQEVKGNWCRNCYQEGQREALEVDGVRVQRENIEKVNNNEEREEAWVQCDQCDGWVHQICGLFNKGRNRSDVPYICPDCLGKGLEAGLRKPIDVRPQAMLEAKDLPRCSLSDFIGERLQATVSEDHVARAKMLNCPLSEVPRAEGLTVRVVNNVRKVMEVKARFLETFKHEGYPGQLPYKQKVILLFQRINGVDVCLYCLYMQEYGDECDPPNRRWVYLSYLDSVKYFQPEVTCASRPGMALRTLVYHDILLSYLEYIKQRGFCSMFIWACPPMQGDDYILHCHPSRQKTPRSDRLREWYLCVLRTAKEKGIVTHLGNLFDTFFEGGKDHKEKASAAHLPYLDGDYWPGEAENLLSSINEEARVAGKKKASNAAKGAARPGKKGKRYGATGTTDEQLMAKLGDTIQSMREDFIVVHLQEPCSFCRTHISDSERWYHPTPPAKVVVKTDRQFEGINLNVAGAATKQTNSLTRFQLCTPCYQNELSGVAGRVRGLPIGISLTDLVAEKVEPIGPTHDTGNPDMACEFFDTRQAFLSLCQGNHYQFDTLRRAKHSSMMVLYHLHNPEAPAFASTCNACQSEIEPGAGFRCQECQDFDLCLNCKQNGVTHPHPLMANARNVNETQVRLTTAQQADRNAQLQRTMALLVHASGCADANCKSNNCNKVKALFQHAVSCTLKVSGNCQLCRRMWALLQLHAKQCQEVDCVVPRCRELRDLRRRQQAREEAQRRSGYKAMFRQQQAAARQQQQGMASPPPGYQQ